MNERNRLLVDAIVLTLFYAILIAITPILLQSFLADYVREVWFLILVGSPVIIAGVAIGITLREIIRWVRGQENEPEVRLPQGGEDERAA